MIEPEHHNWLVHRDLASDESVLEVIDDRRVYQFDDIDLTVGAAGRERYSSMGDDFGSIRGWVSSYLDLTTRREALPTTRAPNCRVQYRIQIVRGRTSQRP